MMEIRTTEEAKMVVADFTERYLNLMTISDQVKEDIKSLKSEFKEEGCPTTLVVKHINELRRVEKLKPKETFEYDTVKEWLESDDKISTPTEKVTV